MNMMQIKIMMFLKSCLNGVTMDSLLFTSGKIKWVNTSYKIDQFLIVLYKTI